MHVPYYVIFDPQEHLGNGVLRGFRLLDGRYEPMGTDEFPGIGLGLRLWLGVNEDYEATWLRWCDSSGTVIPTGKEKAEREGQRAEQERQRAEQERQCAERLREQLRALGIDPSA
jgi:hypothetical protein